MHRDPQSQQNAVSMQRLIAPGCLHPGDLLVIEGRGLDAARGLSLRLELPGSEVVISVDSWQGARLIARLPKASALRSGKSYRLNLTDTQGRPPAGSAPVIEFQVCQAAPARVGGTAPALQTLNPAVPGEVMVLTSAQDSDPAATVTGLGYAIAQRASLAALGQDILRLTLPASKTLDEAVVELQTALPNAVVDANSIYELQSGPRYFAKHAINWTQDFARCADAGKASRIGLIDSGLDLTHPALAEQSIERKSFLTGTPETQGLDHATGIAALLIGRPGIGTPVGLLPAARLYAAEVFERDEDGKARTSSFRLSLALNWLAEEGLRVVNLSFAGPRNAVFSANLAQASRQGMILVAAAGNFGAEAPPGYPAADKAVLAVTAVDSLNRIYAKANRGGHIEFSAPGVDVWTAKAGGGGAYRSGTSFAAPFVSAIIAAEQSLNPCQSSGLLIEGIRRAARDLGTPGRDSVYGWGIVRAPAACRE